MEYDRGRMKQEVRQIMRETRPRPIWVTLLYLIIAAAGAWVIQSVIGGIVGINALSKSIRAMVESMNGVVDPEQAADMIAEFLLMSGNLLGAFIGGSILISILSYLWSSTMAAGYVGYSLDMVRGKNPGVGAIFSAFPKFGRVLITNILVGIFTTLWTLLFGVIFVILVVVAGFLMAAGGVGALIGVLLFAAAYIALLAAAMWVALRFALTNHLVMDQGISGLEALTVSKQLMRGNKWRLFVLQLSFIGWYLLQIVVVLACAAVMGLGVAMILGGSMGGIVGGVILILVMLLVMLVAMLLFSMWLTPYTNGTMVKFYEYTMSQRPDLFSRQPGSDDSFGHPEFPELD